MELNVRDWLLILGSLVVAGFILDVYRRVRAGYSDKMRLSAKQRDDDDELSNPELPGGGARVIPRSKTVPSYEKEQSEQTRETSSRLGDEESDEGPVPVLMDSVGEVAAGDAADSDESAQSAAASLGELALDPGAPLSEPSGDLPEQPSATPPDVSGEKAEANVRRPSGKKSVENSKQPEEIIVLHVVASGDKVIAGNALLQILLACDVRYGRMNIFHRYEEPGGAGAEQFSVVNMVAPGTFDLEDMDNFSTPGVSFFMKLPGPKDAIKAFDCMVETAQVLVKNLGCELQDEARSVCTPQTLQHLRQRIRDFERRQLTLV